MPKKQNAAQVMVHDEEFDTWTLATEEVVEEVAEPIAEPVAEG